MTIEIDSRCRPGPSSSVATTSKVYPGRPFHRPTPEKITVSTSGLRRGPRSGSSLNASLNLTDVTVVASKRLTWRLTFADRPLFFALCFGGAVWLLWLGLVRGVVHVAVGRRRERRIFAG